MTSQCWSAAVPIMWGDAPTQENRDITFIWDYSKKKTQDSTIYAPHIHVVSVPVWNPHYLILPKMVQGDLALQRPWWNSLFCGHFMTGKCGRRQFHILLQQALIYLLIRSTHMDSEMLEDRTHGVVEESIYGRWLHISVGSPDAPLYCLAVMWQMSTTSAKMSFFWLTL